MTVLETAPLRAVAMRMLTRRVSSGSGAAAVAPAARRAYDDLAAVLVPVISEAGVKALVARALHLAQREFPHEAGEEQADDPFGQVSLWLERQHPTLAADAAAATLGTLAALLATFIGEPLTTHYLRKAWPDGFTDGRAKGNKHD